MDFSKVKSFLESDECDNITILTHKSPDGDTLGGAFALCYMLRDMGKKANVINNEPLPKKYKEFMYPDYEPMDFEEKCVIAVDIASLELLGDNLSRYTEDSKIDLCIDHHMTNKKYAKLYCIDADSPAACQTLYELFKYMKRPITKLIAICLYIGITTDTGCFKFESVTPKTHMIAADLISYNINHAYLNRMMFDVKPRGVIKVEQEVLSNLQFCFDDRCAIEFVPKALIDNSGVESAEFEELATIPLTVEGVEIGITIKEKENNEYKLSVRTTDKHDACAFCKSFGGGGHLRAAGCQIIGTYDEVMKKILDRASELFK